MKYRGKSHTPSTGNSSTEMPPTATEFVPPKMGSSPTPPALQGESEHIFSHATEICFSLLLPKINVLSASKD